MKQANDEHRKAIEWLNEHTDDEISFFLVQVELWRIENSKPAVHFNVLEQPNNWAKQVKNKSAEESRINAKLQSYWTDFNEYAQKNKGFLQKFRLKNSGYRSWYNLAIGSSKCSLSMNVNTQTNEQRVEFYIGNDQPFYEFLEEQKEVIQSQIDIPVEWMPLPNKKASRVRVQRTVPILDEATKADQFDWFIRYTTLFYDIFKPYVEQWK